ncbi:MAG: DUF4136 domain-containing protein [Nonlabens sp.]
MKNPKLYSFLFLIAIVVTSCGPAVTTTKSNNADLSSYNSFAYLPNADVNMPDRKQNDKVNSLIIESVNSNMMDAGYKLDRDNPDLLVLISTKVNQETETDTDPVYATYGYYNRTNLRVSPYYNNFYYNNYNTYQTVAGYDTDTYTYKDGTLIVQLVDRKKNKTVWKGVSGTSIYDGATTSAMRTLVNTIFEEYPLMNK